MGAFDSAQQFMSGTRKNASSKPPVLLAWRSSTFFIVMTVCLALFTDIFFYALLIPVVPFSLTVQVGVAEDQVQHWTSLLLACYSLALFLGSPIFGTYADHTSTRRWPLLIGLLALAGSTVLLCLGRTLWLLVVGRLLQGLSASIVWSVGCALLVDTMESAVGVAMGYVNIAMSIGLLIAPVLGGAVYAAAGYYAVYYIAFGVVGVDILMRLAMIEKRVAKQWIRADSEPTASADVEKAAAQETSSTIDIGIAQPTAIGTSRAGHGQTESGLQGSNVLVTAESDLVNRPETTNTPQKRSFIRPLIVLIKDPRLLAALFGICILASIMMGFDAVLALFVQSQFEWSSTAAGLIFLAIFLPGFISPLVGMLSDKYGAKWPVLAGLGVSIPTMVCLRFVTENNINHKVLLGFLLSILGTAMVSANTPLMAEMTYAIQEKAAQNPGLFDERGVYGFGYGLFTMAFALGGVIGPLWAGYVVAAAGWGTMTWSFAVLAAVAALVTYFWIGRPMHHTSGTEPDARPGEQTLADP